MMKFKKIIFGCVCLLYQNLYASQDFIANIVYEKSPQKVIKGQFPSAYTSVKPAGGRLRSQSVRHEDSFVESDSERRGQIKIVDMGPSSMSDGYSKLKKKSPQQSFWVSICCCGSSAQAIAPSNNYSAQSERD